MHDENTPIASPWMPPREQFDRVVDDVWKSRMLSNFGPYCERLERRADRLLGSGGTLAVSSCDTGLVLAWRALGITSGEVIVPSFTFCSTVNSLRWNNLTPVFADIDPRTLCLDPDDVRRRLTSRTVGIAAVHTFGCPAPVDELQAIADEHHLRLVFDAAHGLGARLRGRRLGGCGDASLFSLSGTKVAVAGEGGLAAFRDPEAARRFRELRCYGFLGDYNCQDIGLNGKISELNAGLGWLSLSMLKPAVRRRRRIAAIYRRHLPGLRFQEAADDDRHAYKDFAVIFPSVAARAAAEGTLGCAGVQTKRYFLPVHRMDAYAAHRPIRLPVTDDIADRILCLPIYPELSDAQVKRIAAIVTYSREEIPYAVA